MTVEEPEQPDEAPAPVRGLRSPFVWIGVVVFLAGLAVGGLSRRFPFDPDGLMGEWYVQSLLTALAVIGMLGGAWLIARGYTGRGTTDGLAQHYDDAAP
jgi:hypothetical protein